LQRDLALSTLRAMRPPAGLAVLVVLSISPSSLEAQDADAPSLEVPAESVIVPEPSTEDPAARELDPLDDPRDPSIEEVEAAMLPTLTLPEFRVRVGAGVSIPTSGVVAPYLRLTQDVEWMPPAAEFLSFGIGAAQTTDAGFLTIVQVGARVGGFAWLCEEGSVRCMGAITLQIGAVVGNAVAFDLSADVALRVLFEEIFELGLRGAFFVVDTISWLNISGEIAIAF
jgi:hypothetical protein